MRARKNIVTREMVDAGLSELVSWDHPNLPVCELSEVAMTAAYIAMERARRGLGRDSGHAAMAAEPMGEKPSIFDPSTESLRQAILRFSTGLWNVHGGGLCRPLRIHFLES